MLLVYITKPDHVYDNEKHEFRQFGTTSGKTLLPIYVIGILLAMLLYLFFYYISVRYDENNKHNIEIIEDSDSNKQRYSEYKSEYKTDDYADKYQYYLQQQQIQYLQNQLNQIVQNQMNSQIQNLLYTGGTANKMSMRSELVDNVIL
jgi:hypothetical protein